MLVVEFLSSIIHVAGSQTRHKSIIFGHSSHAQVFTAVCRQTLDSPSDTVIAPKPVLTSVLRSTLSEENFHAATVEALIGIDAIETNGTILLYETCHVGGSCGCRVVHSRSTDGCGVVNALG